MKVYIAADIEGISGIVSSLQTAVRDAKSLGYDGEIGQAGAIAGHYTERAEHFKQKECKPVGDRIVAKTALSALDLV